MQLLFTHLPDEHLEQASNHEQCIVGLPDKQLTVEEEQRKNTTFKVKPKNGTEIDAVGKLAGSTLLVCVLDLQRKPRLTVCTLQ